MIHLSLLNTNTNVAFNSKKKVESSKKQENNFISQASNKILIPTTLFLLSFVPLQAGNTKEYSSDSIETEIITSTTPKSKINPTALSIEELKNAPSPEIIIAGKKYNAGLVVDLSSNKLYRYDSEGDVTDGYRVASGVIGRSGKSITGTGIRKVDHIESYPYKCAPGTKRRRNPKAYGPNILYLTIVDPKTGNNLGSNGEFIHGNNDISSIGKYASHGCIRMDNDVITNFAKEVKPGTLVLIK